MYWRFFANLIHSHTLSAIGRVSLSSPYLFQFFFDIHYIYVTSNCFYHLTNLANQNNPRNIVGRLLVGTVGPGDGE